MMEKKRKVPCEVYSWVVGYLRPVQGWNVGKKQEWLDRVVYSLGKVPSAGVDLSSLEDT